jgi:hypothetical protein
MQKQLEANTKKLQQLNEQKLAIERADNETKNQIDWFKVKSDADYKQQELELMKQKNQIEYAQLFDNNPHNDEVDDSKI